jgi:hypothetical protein
MSCLAFEAGAQESGQGDQSGISKNQLDSFSLDLQKAIERANIKNRAITIPKNNVIEGCVQNPDGTICCGSRQGCGFNTR